MLDLALAYAARGWAVLPLLKGTKKPATSHGFKDATTDPVSIRRWWSMYPDANVGIATGIVSGIVVVDVDCKAGAKGFESLRALPELPETFQVETPSGGEHFYFAVSEPWSGGEHLGSGIDFKADGGYVVAPGSMAGGGTYSIVNDVELAPAPDFLRKKKREPKVKVPGTSVIPERYVAAVVRGETTKLAQAPDGTRNKQLFKTAARLGEFVAANKLDAAQVKSSLTEIALGIGLSDDEVPATIASGFEHGATQPATIPPRQIRNDLEDGGVQPVKFELIVGGDQHSDDPIQLGSHGSSLGHICKVLEHPILLKAVLGPGELRFNEMTLQPEFNGEPVTEELMIRFRRNCELKIFGTGKPPMNEPKVVCFSQETTVHAFMEVTGKKKYHPVKEYLRSLEPVTGAMEELCDAMNLGEIGLARTFVRKWMISAVARAMNPGCKADTVIVIVGPQGYRKSTFFDIMAGSWFGDSYMDIENKDSLLSLRHAWIYEWSELAAMQRARTRETLKAFLASRVDRLRPPYGRTVQEYPRSCVIVGTSNENDFLSDSTGNRRFWPVTITKPIDTDAVKRLRDAAWGEARGAYDAGENWILNAVESVELEDVAEGFMQENPWQDKIEAWLAKAPTVVSVNRIIAEALNLDDAQKTDWAVKQVSAVLKQLGWRRGRRKSRGGSRSFEWHLIRQVEGGTGGTGGGEIAM